MDWFKGKSWPETIDFPMKDVGGYINGDTLKFIVDKGSNPIKMGDLGVAPFMETTKWGFPKTGVPAVIIHFR